jgi:hypothetical protein
MQLIMYKRWDDYWDMHYVTQTGTMRMYLRPIVRSLYNVETMPI